MNKRMMPAVLAGLLMIWGLTGCGTDTGVAEADISAREEGKLATAPNVPPALMRAGNKTVVLNFEAKEFVGEIAEGVKYYYWSFNDNRKGVGSTPTLGTRRASMSRSSLTAERVLREHGDLGSNPRISTSI